MASAGSGCSPSVRGSKGALWPAPPQRLCAAMPAFATCRVRWVPMLPGWCNLGPLPLPAQLPARTWGGHERVCQLAQRSVQLAHVGLGLPPIVLAVHHVNPPGRGLGAQRARASVGGKRSSRILSVGRREAALVQATAGTHRTKHECVCEPLGWPITPSPCLRAALLTHLFSLPGTGLSMCCVPGLRVRAPAGRVSAGPPPTSPRLLASCSAPCGSGGGEVEAAPARSRPPIRPACPLCKCGETRCCCRLAACARGDSGKRGSSLDAGWWRSCCCCC